MQQLRYRLFKCNLHTSSYGVPLRRPARYSLESPRHPISADCSKLGAANSADSSSKFNGGKHALLSMWGGLESRGPDAIRPFSGVTKVLPGS
jgi:hypothetical protein